MKKVIEDCVGILTEDDKKKNEKNEKNINETHEPKSEGIKEKGGFVIKKTLKEDRDPLLRKKFD